MKAQLHTQLSTLAHPSEVLEFDRRPSLAEQVYGNLRQRILSLDLPPNHSLSRIDLSEHYQISQTPLREALQKLGEEGLVATYPQSRTEVSRIDVAQIFEAQFLRKAVEADIVARLAADPTKSRLAAAEETHDRLTVSWEKEQSFEIFVELDKQFHRDLYAAAGLGSLVDMIQKRCGQLDRIRRLHLQFNDSKPEKVVMDHQTVLDTIRSSNVEGARHAMRQHLEGTIGRLEMLRTSYPDYFC